MFELVIFVAQALRAPHPSQLCSAGCRLDEGQPSEHPVSHLRPLGRAAVRISEEALAQSVCSGQKRLRTAAAEEAPGPLWPPFWRRSGKRLPREVTQANRRFRGLRVSLEFCSCHCGWTLQSLGRIMLSLTGKMSFFPRGQWPTKSVLWQLKAQQGTCLPHTCVPGHENPNLLALSHGSCFPKSCQSNEVRLEMS